MEDTQNQNVVTEDVEAKEEARLSELVGKEELDDGEKQELQTLKQSKQDRYQKRIDQLTWRSKSAEERLDARNKELEELKAKVTNLETQTSAQEKPVASDDTIMVGNKQFYTDEALLKMVKEGGLTETDAWKHQRQRDKAELRDEVLGEIREVDKKTTEEQIRQDDANDVLSKYPQFDKNNPSFNPDDALYKEASRIYQNGYAYNPKGLSLAVKEAERLLGLHVKNPDVSDDLGVHCPSAPSQHSQKNDKVELTNDEEEAAVRMYVMGGQTNPKTGKSFTREEAIKKAQQAKEKRLSSRRIT